jgi:hypothetical protein
MENYVQRFLTFIDPDGELSRIRDADLALIPEPVILLGEPGMGKSWMLQKVSKENNLVLRSASSFVAHPNPASLVVPGSKLVIDGLDELPAAQETDPVYRVLGQLLKAGTPPFVLSCRAADWRGAVARQDITAEYGVAPRELTLEPLSREGATRFLEATIERSRAQELIEFLEQRGMPDLYGNPLTLNLLGEVAGVNEPFPRTRPALLHRAVSVMWNERSDRHDNSPLSNLDEVTALTAAGAACAALILTGAEAISLKPSRVGGERRLHAQDLRALPGGENVRSLVGSRLFAIDPEGTDEFKPIHRSVAEFLGAQWLARAAQDDEVRERILAMITFDAGVPASLRGIHAWLPHFDRGFADAVIATDPYGLLRYGDADGLAVEDGRRLLAALKRLQVDNPFFRAEDWTSHSARALGHPELRNELRELLLAVDTNFHLRTLLLEAIRGTDVANALADDLRAIMLETEGRRFSYRERYGAARALVDLDRSKIEWPNILDRLKSKGEDSTRLALEIMSDVGYVHFTAEQVTETVLGHLGLLDRDAANEERSISGGLYHTARDVRDEQLDGILDAIAARVLHKARNVDWRLRSELGDFVTRLILRRVRGCDPDARKLLSWLRITPGRHGYSEDLREGLTNYLQTSDAVRHAIQRQVMFVERTPEELWSRLWRLGEVHSALALGADDVIFFLNELASIAAPNEGQVEVWRELTFFARRFESRSEEILAVARSFARGNPALAEHLSSLSQPAPRANLEIEDERRRKRQERSKAKAWAEHRKHFGENLREVRAGELRWSLPASQAYLGLFSDTDSHLSPPDRLGDWLGPEVQVVALEGIAGVLDRPDLPSLEQVAESYAQSRRWNFVLPMIASTAERIRLGRSLDDVPVDVLITVRIALHHEALGDRIDTELLSEELERQLRAKPANYERYIRLLIEPSLIARATHIMGLYAFLRAPADQALAARLAQEWLVRFPNLPLGVESELVDALADAGAFDALRALAHARANAGYSDEQHRRTWQAVGLLVDFEATAAAVGTVAEDEKSLLWHLRQRLAGERPRERPMPLVTAQQLAWVIRQFRSHWPSTRRPTGVTSGDTNPWDAAEFLELLINRLGGDPSDAATAALEGLIANSQDSYTDLLRYAADLQRRARREANFPGITLDQLKAVIEKRQPQTTGDLLAIIRWAITRLQMELRGSDTDRVGKYYRDDGRPRDEDSCTDRLIEDIHALLSRYDIGRVPQRDMPAGKRVDIAFTSGDLSLPVECKGQWNASLWTAPQTQLEQLYLRDWRAQDRGLYIVYWFGAAVSGAYRLKGPPHGVTRPSTAEALRLALIDRLPPERRGSIAIEVLDLTR